MPKKSDMLDSSHSLKWILDKLEEHDRVIKEICVVLRDIDQTDQIGAIRLIISAIEEESDETYEQNE